MVATYSEGVSSTASNHMDQTRDQSINSNGEPLNSLVTLPTELIVYIFSFLTINVHDIVKLRCVSRTLRSACEIPSLWREFIWPRLDIREEGGVKSVLKSYGQNVQRLSFPDHVPTPAKLTALLQHCINLVELCIPTRKLSPNQLKKIIYPLGKLQSLDILWTSDIRPLLVLCGKLEKLTIRIEVKLAGISSSPSTVFCSLLGEWVIQGFVPQTLNVVVGQTYQLTWLARDWLHFNPRSPTNHTGCFKVFSSLKVPMDLYPALPDFQLQFGQSCTLPFVKPSKCGLLGLEEWNMLLTDTTYHGQVVHKAMMTKLSPDIECSHFSSDITCLSFVTHFDASQCGSLHSGHLEQVAMACPKLQHLNLKGNSHCLERLQGLYMLLACKNLRGLNLLDILEVESHIRLWKILVDMKLTYLAIQLCVLIPWELNGQAEPEIVSSFQKCLNLKALEVWSRCNRRQRDFSVLSHFPSLVHYLVDHVDVAVIVNNCTKLKYLSSCYAYSSHLLPQNNNLEQLCIHVSSSNTDTFLQSISAHGGLVHVVLSAITLYDDGITGLIENSPNLITCHLYACVRSSDPDYRLNMRDFIMTLKSNFHDRKLFTCGSFKLATVSHQAINNILVRGNMDIISFWSQYRF